MSLLIFNLHFMQVVAKRISRYSTMQRQDMVLIARSFELFLWFRLVTYVERTISDSSPIELPLIFVPLCSQRYWLIISLWYLWVLLASFKYTIRMSSSSRLMSWLYCFLLPPFSVDQLVSTTWSTPFIPAQDSNLLNTLIWQSFRASSTRTIWPPFRINVLYPWVWGFT